MSNQVKVLSLNGGGVRGLYTVSVLAEIERIIGVTLGEENVCIGDYFDLISGTSIGGIVALALASGKSARSVKAEFYKSAATIFPQKSGFRKFIKRMWLPLYSSHALSKAITEMIDVQMTFGDLKRRVMIPAVNLTTGRPQFFKTPHNPRFTRDARLKIFDAAMATSAAPTYFAPHYCEDLNAHFADGGLVANNPSYVSYLEVLNDMKCDFNGVTPQDVKVLNVGTLGEEYSIKPKSLGRSHSGGYLGLWGGGETLVLTTMTANQHLHGYMLKRELSNFNCADNYVVLTDQVSNDAASEISLDNASNPVLVNLMARAETTVTDRYASSESLRSFFNEKASQFQH